MRKFQLSLLLSRSCHTQALATRRVVALVSRPQCSAPVLHSRLLQSAGPLSVVLG
jgi:hypothetical protein